MNNGKDAKDEKHEMDYKNEMDVKGAQNERITRMQRMFRNLSMRRVSTKSEECEMMLSVKRKSGMLRMSRIEMLCRM